MSEEQAKPFTLYVEDIETELKIGTDKPRKTVVDIELSKENAEILAIYLQARNREHDNGAIRVRMVGRLIIS
jgi:hypothetical protein